MRKSESEYDVVLAFGFGAPANLPSNEALRSRAEYLRELLCLPVCSAWTAPSEEEGVTERLSTLRYIKRFALAAAQNNWKIVLVVAAPDHIARCLRDLHQMGFFAAPDPLLRVRTDLFQMYQRESEQWWTRWRWVFLAREFILLHLPWRVYQRLTG